MRCRFFIFPLLLFCLWMPGGCSGTVHEAQQEIVLTPMPPDPVDPDNTVLHEAIRAFLLTHHGPVSSGYRYTRIDLDGDTRRDALVMLNAPYGYWCGMPGCTLLVMQAHDTSFTLVNTIQPVRGPMYIEDERTNGWRNLIVRVSGSWEKAKDVALRFDGQTYPSIPLDLPAYDLRAFRSAQAVFK